MTPTFSRKVGFFYFFIAEHAETAERELVLCVLSDLCGE
jgi:hypothetical protein